MKDLMEKVLFLKLGSMKNCRVHLSDREKIVANRKKRQGLHPSSCERKKGIRKKEKPLEHGGGKTLLLTLPEGGDQRRKKSLFFSLKERNLKE